MQQQIRILQLIQCSFKCRNQLRRQITDKPNRICQQCFGAIWQIKCSGGRIQCSKQLVLHINLIIGQRIQQRRFPRIGVAYQCYQWQVVAQFVFLLHFTMLAHLTQLILNHLYSLTNPTTVCFQLGFPRASSTYTAAFTATTLTRQVNPLPQKSRQQITGLSQFYLQFTFTASCTLCKNI